MDCRAALAMTGRMALLFRSICCCGGAGFGLGLERFVLFVTGMGNIRDVIPFPRTPKSAEF